MIYISKSHQSLSYVYSLIWTKSLLNLCVHMYTWESNSFPNVTNSEIVHVRKTKNVDFTREIIDSLVFFSGRVSNSTSAVTIPIATVIYHNDRCEEDPTSTETLANQVDARGVSNVDSRLWVIVQC